MLLYNGIILLLNKMQFRDCCCLDFSVALEIHFDVIAAMPIEFRSWSNFSLPVCQKMNKMPVE